MPGLVPGIHVFRQDGGQDVDGRDEPGHDERESFYLLRPSIGVIASFARSMPSMQLTLSATTSVPSGFLPLAKTSTPQSMQHWCRIACLLNRYSFRLSSPARSTKLFGGTKVKCRPFLVQIEQLHAVTMARSVVHSKRTRPQWQPPVRVLLSGIDPPLTIFRAPDDNAPAKHSQHSLRA